MLILSRKLNESIDLYLGGQLVGTVTVHELSATTVRVAINADQNMRVVRSELTVDGQASTPKSRVLEHA